MLNKVERVELRTELLFQPQGGLFNTLTAPLFIGDSDNKLFIVVGRIENRLNCWLKDFV